MTLPSRRPLRRIVIVDDHQLFREGLTALLSADFTILGQGATSGEARALTVQLRPDVLLLDVELGGEPAEALVRAVRREAPATAVVILTMFEDDVLRWQLLRAGASAYLTKTIDQELLVRTLRTVRPDLTPVPQIPDSRDELLSPREREVLRLIAAAASNRTIAGHLHITEGTVKRHTSNLYAKLDATSRIDAVQKAARLGLLAE